MKPEEALKKISVEHLREGMFLHGLCGAWSQHPFWRTKFVIKKAEDIALIIDSGITEVWINASKGLDVKEPEMAPAAATPPPPPAHTIAQPQTAKLVPIGEELQRAAYICETARQAVKAMFRQARLGKAVSGQAANALVDEISASVSRNPGALISLARLKTADDYTYMHSIAVCALMVSLSKMLDLDEKQTREAGMAGLLHDLGKVLIPIEILNKPGKLDKEEFDLVKSHAELGHELLTLAGNAPEAALDVCLHHHEKSDGSGYPHGLKEDQISIFAKMGAVCDVYDAITSNRPYKDGWDPAEAIRKMTEWCNGHFDKRIFQAFVKSIGIYPIGSMVRLASGRLAVVVEQSPASLLKPKVRVFFSTKSQVHIAPITLDLSRAISNDSITGVEDPATWGIKNLNQYWMA